MRSNYFRLFITIISILVPSSLVLAQQVTFGSNQPPVKGSVLQIKDKEPELGYIDDISKNTTSTNGGLLLPKVELTDINSLKSVVDITDEEEISRHTGLIVYHIGSTNIPQAGIYFWTDNKWNLIYKGHVHTSPWNKVGTVFSAKENTDDMYLNACVVINDSGNSNSITPADDQSKLSIYGNDININGVRFGHGYANISSNIALGNNSLSTASAGNNTALGFNALSSSALTGDRNIATGVGALSNLNSGYENVAVGNESSKTLTTGSKNITLGYNVQPKSADATNQINISNTIYGDITNQRVGINTDNPQATLEVDGKIKLTETSAIGGGKVLTIGADGVITKSKIAPRKAAFLGSKNTQSINRDLINQGSTVAVTWESSSLTHNDDILNPISNTVEEVTISRAGLYELSGYLSYNPQAAALGTAPPASENWLTGVIVGIQYRLNSSNNWVELMNVISIHSAVALKMPKDIEIPPINAELPVGAQIRMVLYKPTSTNYGLAHGSTTAAPSISKFTGNGYTKILKIVSL